MNFLRNVARECRGAGARLVYFTGCLAIGVAAVVVVAGLSSSLEKGIRSGAKELLGADLSITARNEFPGAIDEILADLPDHSLTNVREQPATVQHPGGASTLVELKILDGPYPYFGSLDLKPDEPMEELLADGVVVEADIMEKLSLSVGDELRVGGETFRVNAVANANPDRITGFMYIGPRVYLSQESLERTNLGNLGVRIRYEKLIRFDDDLPPEELAVIGNEVDERIDPYPGVRSETYIEGRPSLQRGLARLDHFLGLVALLSLLLGGVGVAQAVRAWIEGRLDSIAILKCVGMRPREVFYLYFGQAALLGFAGSIVGVIVGVFFLVVAPPLFSEHIPAELIQPWQPWAYLRGIALGVFVALLFSVPPLIAVLRVSPARVFRRNAEPLPEARWVPRVTFGVVVGGIAVLAAFQSASPFLGFMFTLATVATGLVLALAAWALARSTALVPRDLGNVWLRHGLAALSRPGASTVASIVGLGLGLLVLLATALVQSHLSHQLVSELPKTVPSVFMIDVRPDQWEDLQSVLARHGADEIRAVPIVMGRIAAIDGVDAETRAEQLDRGWRRRQLMSQQQLTYYEELPPDNEILEGELWSKPDTAELSLEREFAGRLGLELGSTVDFNFFGTTRSFEVTTIRDVEWDSFNPNFEIVAEPGTLDDVPQLRVASARIGEADGQAIQNAVAEAFPNITFIQAAEVIDRIALQLSRIGWGVRMLGLFVIGAGVAVLAGTVGIESRRRGREVALLKTLGMTRRQVVGLLATEYALVGAVAAVIGAAGGGVVAWLAITRGMEIEWVLNPMLFGATIAGGMATATLAGIGASTSALRKRPIEVLRYE